MFKTVSKSASLLHCRRLQTAASTSRSRSCNASFFSSWNPPMAYWLGFLFADGNVSWCKRDKRWSIRLGLKCIDYGHVEKYKDAMDSTYHLGITKNKESCLATHAIYNNQLALDLIALGCIPKKSLTLQWPTKLPQQYANHFVRGYFDGDGCIRFHAGSPRFVAHFVGSAGFIPVLQSYIKQHVLADVKAKGCVYHDCNGNCWRLDYNGNQTPMKVLHWMYEDSDETIRLDRKYALYQQFKNVESFKRKERKKQIMEFLNSQEWKKHFQCEYQHRCPHLHDIPNANRNPHKIVQVDNKNGSFLRCWDSAYAISKELGHHSGFILKVCRNERKSAYGYKWQFADY